MEPAFFNYINFIHGVSQFDTGGWGGGGGISGLFCGLNQVSVTAVTIWTAPAERNKVERANRTDISAI